MDTEKNLALFQELICCGGNVYTWQYDPEGNLLSSNCPHEALFGEAFSILGCMERALSLGWGGEGPQIVGTSFGLLWGVDFTRDCGNFLLLHVIGPVFSCNVSAQDIENGFNRYADPRFSLAWKHRLVQAYEEVPVVPHQLFVRYLLMLHYCLTGERLDPGDTAIRQSVSASAPPELKRDRHRIWMAERAMLDMVRNGDINYRKALNQSILLSEGVPVRGRDPLRQAKTSVTVFISLVCRAAIEGGLSPEEAYAIGDSCIQSVEDARTYDEVRAIPNVMYDDFVRRVHRARQNPRLSSPIAQCRDYIQMHLEEKIRARDLAELVGYTEYYVTHKFREETGLSVNDYIKKARVDRARMLLRCTDLSVQEISEKLGFGSRNYFSRVFSEIAGTTPAEYRENPL